MTHRPQWISAAMAATLSVSVLAGCPSTPTVPGQALPSASPTGNPTGTPTAAPTGAPTSNASPPSGATSAPSSLPSTPDTSSRATIQGSVFSDKAVRLDGVTVTGKLLGAGTFSNGSDTLTVATQLGSYALNGAPTGSTILITASKDGYTVRQQTIVPLSNLQGDVAMNNVSFGAGTDRIYPLSDAPEVIAFTPAVDATGVDPATRITLTFNEAVNASDVESAMSIFVAGTFTTAGAPAPSDGAVLTALDDAGSPIRLPFAYDSSRDDGSDGDPVQRVTPDPQQHCLFDATAFTAVWSDDRRTVSFSFKPTIQLPTDRDITHLPRYAVSFQGKEIRDLQGAGRSTDWFRVSPAQQGRVGYVFQVAADPGIAPGISVVTGLNQGDGGLGTDRIRVQFSKPMHLFPRNFGGKAIPGLAAPTSAARLANYRYAVKDALVGGDGDGDLLASLSTQTGSSLAEDPSRRTIEFAPSSDDPLAGTGKIGFTSGATIWVKAGATITDPAGNVVDPTKVLKSGRAI